MLTCRPSGELSFPPVRDLIYGFCVVEWRQLSLSDSIPRYVFGCISHFEARAGFGLLDDERTFSTSSAEASALNWNITRWLTGMMRLNLIGPDGEGRCRYTETCVVN